MGVNCQQNVKKEEKVTQYRVDVNVSDQGTDRYSTMSLLRLFMFISFYFYAFFGDDYASGIKDRVSGEWIVFTERFLMSNILSLSGGRLVFTCENQEAVPTFHAKNKQTTVMETMLNATFCGIFFKRCP